MTRNHKQSQSLIETIVAVSIVVIGVVAILAVGLAHLSLGGQSAERIAAVNLSREGIELVLALRNSSWLDPSQSWPYGLGEDAGNHIIDYIDPLTLTTAGNPDITLCDNCQLYTNNDAYSHTSATSSIYKRLITIEDGDALGGNCPTTPATPDDCEKKIISTVYWQERGRPHTIVLEARITDWR